jgi:hypothetical protein
MGRFSTRALHTTSYCAQYQTGSSITATVRQLGITPLAFQQDLTSILHRCCSWLDPHLQVQVPRGDMQCQQQLSGKAGGCGRHHLARLCAFHLALEVGRVADAWLSRWRELCVVPGCHLSFLLATAAPVGGGDGALDGDEDFQAAAVRLNSLLRTKDIDAEELKQLVVSKVCMVELVYTAGVCKCRAIMVTGEPGVAWVSSGHRFGEAPNE